MNELRWILLLAGLALIGLLYWQGRRRQVAQDRPREIIPPQLGDGIVARKSEPAIVARPAHIPFEELPEVNVHAAPPTPAAPVLSMDQAMSTAALNKLTITQPMKVEASVRIQRPSVKSTESRPARKIVALRVPGIARRIDGARLREMLVDQGLRHGRYGIFHRHDAGGATQFSVASMVEPGAFDLGTMSETEYPGVSLFMQLPGPTDARAAFDAMLACAQLLQREFDADLQGERGKPLTGDMLTRMREEIAHFEHLASNAS